MEQIVVIAISAVKREIHRACPHIPTINDNEFVVHERFTRVGHNLNAGCNQILYFWLLNILTLHNHSDDCPGIVSVKQRIANAPQIQVIRSDVHRMLRPNN